MVCLVGIEFVVCKEQNPYLYSNLYASSRDSQILQSDAAALTSLTLAALQQKYQGAALFPLPVGGLFIYQRR